MLNNFEYIQKLYTVIKTQKRLNNEYAIIFVYNSPETMNDTKHSSECIFQEELHMIVTSFRKTAEVVYAIDGENKFINCILDLKRKHKYLLVYSMAQNLNGDGRRSLIPLLCDYYNLINIGGDFISTVMGRSKDVMYSILQPKGFPFPKTYYLRNTMEIQNVLPYITSGRWILKPNNESSSIGLQVHDFSQYKKDEIYTILKEYQKEYPVYCVQEFITGEEVAVPILKIKDNYYCPGISQVDFPEGRAYIDYNMVNLETYGYFEYQGVLKEKLFEISYNVSKTLRMSAMSRIDFRIRNNIPYIEDIGANPTISAHNGVSQLYCDYLQDEPHCIYSILVYAALIEKGLFKPSF